MKRPESLEIPIVVVIAFNLFTLGVFATAPIRWATENTGQLYLLVLVCQVMIVLGFNSGRHTGQRSLPERALVLSSGERLFNVLLAIYAITFLVNYAYLLRYSLFDVVGMINTLWAGVQDPALGRALALAPTTPQRIPWSVYFAISVFNQIFFIAGFLQWKTLNSAQKAGFAIFVCIELFYWIGRGTAYGVIALITTGLFASMLWTRKTRPTASRRFASLLAATVLMAGAVAFFSYLLYARSGNVERDVETFETDFGNSTLVPGHPTLGVVPEPLHPTYLNTVSYLAQGYFNTSLAFDLPFRPTYFLCNNPSVKDMASVVGLDFWEDSYIHRLGGKGVDEYMYWHSAYTWYANDVSFYGVPFVLFLLGYFFGFSWSRSLRGDFLSKVVFVIFGNMLLFLFANNTFLSCVFYSFIFIVPYWLLTRSPWPRRV